MTGESWTTILISSRQTVGGAIDSMKQSVKGELCCTRDKLPFCTERYISPSRLFAVLNMT